MAHHTTFICIQVPGMQMVQPGDQKHRRSIRMTHDNGSILQTTQHSSGTAEFLHMHALHSRMHGSRQ